MDFPRLIHLDEETETRLRSYINQELLIHYGERGQFVEELIAIQNDYFAEPSTEVKTFPFKGAANLIIPLQAIVIESLHSKAMTTLFALDDFVTVKVPDQSEDINLGLSKYINYELLENGANMYRFADDALLENFKFGSMVGKAGYEKVVKTAVKTVGDKEYEFEVTTRQGSIADAVPLANFLLPFSAQDPQTSPWVGEEHVKTAYETKQMCDSGFFYDSAWEDLENYILQTNAQELSSTPYRQNMERQTDQTPVWPKTIGFVELWLSFDVDNSKKDKEIQVFYHRLSQKFLAIRYNWYDDLRRPYRLGKYFNIEHRWPGMGVGRQVKSFQREITIQHRQRLDNATIANIRMFKVNKLAGYGPGEPIFPGKLWFVDNMEDIEELQAGEVYPSSFNDEIQSLQYAQQRSGINELNLGMPQSGTPGTASSDMARLQEGNKKSDYTMKATRIFLTQIARDLIYNTFQFGTRDVQIYNYIPNGVAVKQFIETSDLTLLREQLICNIQVVGQNNNQLQDRASWTQLSGQLTQYYTQLFQFAMQIKDQNLMMLLAKYIPSGATEAMKQILTTFNVPNMDRIIPEELIFGFTPTPQEGSSLLLPSNTNGPNQTNPSGGASPNTGAIQAPGMGTPPSTY